MSKKKIKKDSANSSVDVPADEIDAQEGMSEDSILREIPEKTDVDIQRKEPFLPINESQAMFAIITPDYASLPEETRRTKFGKQLENFQSGHRLGNISPAQAAECLYDFQISAEAADLGMPTVAAAFTSDYTARVEFSHPTKGFRTKFMNYLRQDISDNRKPAKHNAFGQKKEED